MKTPFLDMLVKTAGSALRESVDIRFNSESHMGPTWEMFFKNKPKETIGTIRVSAPPGQPAEIWGSQIVEKWRGKGLGKKMYGEVVRRHPQLMSDSTLSPYSFGTWSGLARRSSKDGIRARKMLPMTALKVSKNAKDTSPQLTATTNQFVAAPSAKSAIGNFGIVKKLPKHNILTRVSNSRLNAVQHAVYRVFESDIPERAVGISEKVKKQLKPAKRVAKSVKKGIESNLAKFVTKELVRIPSPWDLKRIRQFTKELASGKLSPAKAKEVAASLAEVKRLIASGKSFDLAYRLVFHAPPGVKKLTRPVSSAFGKIFKGLRKVKG